MPRKAHRRPEPLDRATSVQRAYRQREVIYQCLECGAPADPLYGVGDQSWCHHCSQGGTVIGEEGKFPFPHLYEQWRRNQRHQVQQEREQVDITPLHLATSKKAATMHSVKTHTGTFYCPRCWIEGELLAQ